MSFALCVFSASLLFRATLFCSNCGNLAKCLASVLRVLSPHSSHADFSLASVYEHMPDVAEHRHSFVEILPDHRYKLCPTVYLSIEDLFHILFHAFLKEKPFHMRHSLIQCDDFCSELSLFSWWSYAENKYIHSWEKIYQWSEFYLLTLFI